MFKEELYMFLFLLFIISLSRILPFLAKYCVFILYFVPLFLILIFLFRLGYHIALYNHLKSQEMVDAEWKKVNKKDEKEDEE